MQFDTLDVSLQDEFDKFLQERGINQTLAYFVPEYAEYKEQKVCLSAGSAIACYGADRDLQEYVRWLDNVKGFVEA